jgi:ABC-2 type transport system ATP-binding protein
MLEFNGAVKRFGPLVALDRCTFAARPGRLTGFLGPNGAGKTMAMRAVFGLVALDAGVVRWQGRLVTAAEQARFGYMPEERGLYPRMRVRGPAGLPRRAVRPRGWMPCHTATSSGFS